MDALEALKNEGNALFQQQRFVDAVRVYSSVLDQLRDAGTVTETAARLEAAVRLNRAWAWIQMPGSECALTAAEQDCGVVIEKDPLCVKAYYRRALVRERRGQWKMAMGDVAVMKRLEPANPSIGPLLERLQKHSEEQEDLVPKLQQCSTSSGGNSDTSADTSTVALAGEAQDAWHALQAAEMNVQKVYKATAKRSSMAHRKPKRAQKDKKVPLSGLPSKGEILHKTDDIWDSLRREEITTVAKAFPQSRKGTSVGRS
ncbi:hypothetical protein PHYPSEUDO_014029 [Phytophthora pseudosyringae]|uniref:Uncharacterized protein n=1 Tax=Phytophthora pseudosyringae TaxID=221518 RepID=A0A8T1W1L8_9STRA|nr:hypothetical protein PHYPSEUDO_014029 [Phytophthora pseudosyringae]